MIYNYVRDAVVKTVDEINCCGSLDCGNCNDVQKNRKLIDVKYI